MVNPITQSTFPNSPPVTELLGFEEDILSGFEGYHRMGDIVAKEIVMFDGNMGNF